MIEDLNKKSINFYKFIKSIAKDNIKSDTIDMINKE